MIVAIASGKGGTGKTTLAASLATVWPRPVAAVDLDVEEPNLHLFLRPEFGQAAKAGLPVPAADMDKCTRCGVCADLCQFGAISVIGKELLLFPEMCHGCGGCLELCPEGALSYGERLLGEVVPGLTLENHFLMGRLRVGEAQSPPLMRAVLSSLAATLAATPMDAILDCPPGVSCPAMTAVRGGDVILLAAEPTPFGLHDFALAVEAFAPLGKPMAVAINRAGLGDGELAALCRAKGLPILAAIPFDRSLAEGYARGRVAANHGPEMAGLFADLARSVIELARGGRHD